jgi:hypothetical protein
LKEFLRVARIGETTSVAYDRDDSKAFVFGQGNVVLELAVHGWFAACKHYLVALGVFCDCFCYVVIGLVFDIVFARGSIGFHAEYAVVVAGWSDEHV